MEFYETKIGRSFLEHSLPEIISALKRIACIKEEELDLLKQSSEKQKSITDKHVQEIGIHSYVYLCYEENSRALYADAGNINHVYITDDPEKAKQWFRLAHQTAKQNGYHELSVSELDDYIEDFKNGKLRREYQDCFVAPRPKEELFEIKKDIHCLKNVASKRKSRKKLEQLRLVLRTWQESVGDVFPGEFNLKQDDGRFERPLGR